MQQKQILPDRLNKLAKRIKSYAFMRIFMNESQSPRKANKLRHYDLELQGAMAVYGWLKKKLQQVYIRGYYRLKDYNESPQSSPKLVSEPQSPSIPSLLKLQSTSKRVRCQTDRQAYQRQKQSYKVDSSVKGNSRKVYRSEYGGEGLGGETDRKSGLKDLLNKVRQVNSQSRVINKENSVGRENYGSRVGCSTVYEQDFVKHRHYTNKSSLQQTKRGNELSFCTYGHHEQTVRKQVTQTPHDKSISYMNIQNQASMDKNNLLSLKKWHRRQKRAIIIQKISELQNSLYAQYSRQDQLPYSNQEQWQFSQGNYSGLYRMPTNYSQVYLQRVRQPTRSVMDVRVGRK